ncbi:aldo/keto reductase [Xanthomonas fragariae]|uniref:aldo/keto reductase n=1 Tax=Xanthomonas fragariae TaxID=48664 RepID=UPI000D54CCF2|nr:aldo/keto reductase [Xanthomonas fragariae]MDM7553778.1 aldo/keto reductase [Xanthomonas fragariae]MDM7556949.1 aldo/keto reductase [Xanthomonas fragariae]MDM7574633.1 aldo/keto reductase [Xanthomonas fragariae]MDM7577766.1 aldo/keto reductase [Xanthomonas fragariae]MDM7587965.1 aldo/keto reductase [Xanthomonas fragariae]
MNTRRQFLCAAAAGTVALAAAPLMAQSSAPGSVMPTRGKTAAIALPANPVTRSGRYRPTSRLGFGGVAIGNAFAPTSDAQSEHTLAAVWESGVRYFDTSPWYGLGLSERRTGHHLHRHAPADYVLSTKVGRLLSATDKPPKTMWQQPSPFDYRYDYSASGVRRSIEDGLQRLGVSQIDIAYIHDLSPENEQDLGTPWQQRFAEAVKGAMPELTKMRKEGLIKAWGFGVNRPEPALRAIEEADPDIFLLACQYSLLDHAQALHDTFPKIAKHGASVVVGAPLLAGYLAGRDRYLYDDTVPEWAPAKRQKALAICDRHGVDLRTVSLQFAAAPKVVSAVIPGARTAEQAHANAASMRVAIPAAVWEELKREHVIEADAPVPVLS